MCRGWHAAGADLPELWECVEAGYLPLNKLECTEPLLSWLDAWCATQQRPLRRLELNLWRVVTAPDVAAGLVTVLRRSSATMQHLKLLLNESFWEELVRDEHAIASGFLAAIAALQQLTSLEVRNPVACTSVLPSRTVLPTSLQRLVYYCGNPNGQFSQLTRLEHLSMGARTPLPASQPLPHSLRELEVVCTEFPAELAHLARLEKLALRGGGEFVCKTNRHVTALSCLTRVRVFAADTACS